MANPAVTPGAIALSPPKTARKVAKRTFVLFSAVTEGRVIRVLSSMAG
jgi:hypothetical protein